MNIPAERLFWSIVEAAGVRAGPLPAGLWPLLEEDVPVDPNLLWAVSAPIDEHRLLICAALKADLSALSPPDGVLTPDHVPDVISSSVDPASLNLLVGEFEPVHLRTSRQRRRLTSAAAWLLSATLIGVGLERRSSAWREESHNAATAAQSVIASLSTSLGWSRDDLALELVQRRQAAPPDLHIPGDAALAIAGLLESWPTRIAAKTQSISASGEVASISVLISGDAAAFISAIRPPEGWKLQEPRLIGVDTSTRINLELRRAIP